jgi:Ion channel
MNGRRQLARRSLALIVMLVFLASGSYVSYCERIYLDSHDLYELLRVDSQVEHARFSADDLRKALFELRQAGTPTDRLIVRECSITGAISLGELALCTRRVATDEEGQFDCVPHGGEVNALFGLHFVASDLESLWLTSFDDRSVVFEGSLGITDCSIDALFVSNCLFLGAVTFSGSTVSRLTLLDSSFAAFREQDAALPAGAALDLSEAEIGTALCISGCDLVGDLDLYGLTCRGSFEAGNVDVTGAALLTQAFFHRFAVFSDFQFGGTVEFGGLAFSGGVDFHSTVFSRPEDAIHAYRLAASSWRNLGDREKADAYFLRQMVAHRDTLPVIARVLEIVLVDWTSHYGTSWLHVLRAWFCVIVVSSILFYLGKGIEDPSCGNAIRSLRLSIYFSIVTFTTLGYGDYRPRGGYKALACFLAISGAYMMALFVYVFARSFMA